MTSDMPTLSGVLNKLKVKKIDKEFEMTETGFVLQDHNKVYAPGDLKIICTYRFEGASDPDDNAVLYLIETNDGKIGFNIDSYGAYSNNSVEGYDDFIKKIPVEDRPEQAIFGEDNP